MWPPAFYLYYPTALDYLACAVLLAAAYSSFPEASVSSSTPPPHSPVPPLFAHSETCRAFAAETPVAVSSLSPAAAAAALVASAASEAVSVASDSEFGTALPLGTAAAGWDLDDQPAASVGDEEADGPGVDREKRFSKKQNYRRDE